MYIIKLKIIKILINLKIVISRLCYAYILIKELFLGAKAAFFDIFENLFSV